MHRLRIAIHKAPDNGDFHGWCFDMVKVQEVNTLRLCIISSCYNPQQLSHFVVLQAQKVLLPDSPMQPEQTSQQEEQIHVCPACDDALAEDGRTCSLCHRLLCSHCIHSETVVGIASLGKEQTVHEACVSCIERVEGDMDAQYGAQAKVSLQARFVDTLIIRVGNSWHLLIVLCLQEACRQMTEQELAIAGVSLQT